MKKNNLLNNALLLAASVGCIAPLSLAQAVTHKNNNLSNYLDQLNANQPEKTSITEVIQKTQRGCFIDIGSGGDSIMEIVEKIPKNKPITVFAADVSLKVVESIPVRYPKLKPYLNQDQKNTLQVKLAVMDATDMRNFKNSSVCGINASAVVHEIHSYVPNGITRFFSEAIRILEPNGFVVYRDPALQSHPENENLLVLKSASIKYFATLFLPRFLDTLFTQIRDKNGKPAKPDHGYKNSLQVLVYLKNESFLKKLSFEEFLNTPTKDIDFSKNIALQAPRRLLSEIERHYVLFLKNVFPVGFIGEKKLQKGAHLDEITPLLAKNVVQAFLEKQKIQVRNQVISKKDIDQMKKEFTNIENFVQEGIVCEGTHSLNTIKKILTENKVSPNLYAFKDRKVWLDAKLYAILFQGKNEGVLAKFAYTKKDVNLPLESLNWLKREGEEHYYYFSQDELFTFLCKLALYRTADEKKKNYMLAPVETLPVVQTPRELYNAVLERDTLQLDMLGNKQNFVTDKNIIKFQLVKEKEAIKRYMKLIKDQPHQYPHLARHLQIERNLTLPLKRV